MFPAQLVKNCLKRATGRFHKSRSKTHADTARVRKKRKKGDTDTDKSDTGRQLK
jgi:hypothetical protein